MTTEAQIVVSAVDKASAVLKNIGDGVGAVTNQFQVLGTAVSGFAALAGVTAFTGMISGSIEAADSLNDLSKKTGLAVETLSGIALAAKQSGTDLEGVSQSINKLGINIAKDTEKFARLGITAKEPLEAFKQLADVVSKIEDPQKRAAVAAEALGKSWQSSMPLLAEGSQKIQEMVDKGKKLSGMTQELAEQSDQFNDQMAELTTTFGGVAKSITLQMLPTLNQLTNEFITAQSVGLGFFDMLYARSSSHGSNPGEKLKNATQELENLTKALNEAMASNRLDGGSIDTSGMASKISSLKKQIDYYSALTEKVGGVEKSTAALTDTQKAGVDAFIKGASDTKSAAEKAADALFNLRLAQEGANQKEAIQELAGLAKSQAEYAKNIDALISPLEKQAYELERQVELYGQTESAIQATIVSRLEEARALAKENGAWDDHLEFLDREIEARKRIGTAASQKEFLDSNKAAAELSAREWEKFSDDINRSLTDSLFRAFESGESFGKSFAKSQEATFKTMVLKFAVNYVMNGSGQIIGSLGNSALNSILGTGSSNSGGGINYLGLANNASTANTLYGALAGLSGTTVGASSASLLYANGVGMVGGDSLGALIAANGSWSGVGTGSAAAGSGASGGTGAAAGVSSVAWIAAIVAGMWMSSEAWKAGIRWENYAKQADVALWDAEVAIRAAHDEPARAIFGDDFVNSQFYAIMGGGSLSAQIHYGIQSALFGAKRVTGTQTTGTFSEAEQGFSGAYGVNMKKTGGLFSSSREWTDWYALPTEVDTIMDTLYRGVRNSFVMLGETFDDTSIAAKLQGFVYSFNVASTDMATIANSASAGLSEAMGNLLTPSVSALKKSGESWSAAFERILTETNAVTRVLDLMGDTMSGTFGANNLDGILKASDSFIALFGSIDLFNAAFAGYYSNFYTQSEQFAQSWQDMQVQFDRLEKTMPTTRQGFRDLVDSLDLSTDSGRNTYTSLMTLQSAFAALTPTLEDAAAAAAALTNTRLETQAQQIGKVLEDQRKAQADAVRGDITTAQTSATTAATLIETFTQISASLGSYRNSLQASALSPSAQYAESKRLYESTATAARLGDTTAAGNLQSQAEAFLQAALATGTAGSYARDVANVASTVDAVIGLADRQIPIAQTQLEVAQQQLVTLNALLERVTGSQGSIVVSNYAQAATDWATFFASTSIGGVMQTAAGTMQRLSDTVGMFIDNSGMGYTFSSSDSPYALASVSDAWRQEMLTRYGQWTVPTFASGGYHSGGLRLVGENGPELEMTGPSSIINASETAALLNGSTGLAEELRALRREVAALRAEQRAGHSAIAANTRQAARTLEKFDIDGAPEVRAA